MSNDKAALQKLGKRIKEVRNQLGFTQEHLAELCDFDRTYIGLIERGKRNPSFLTLCTLAKYLKTSVSDLAKGV